MSALCAGIVAGTVSLVAGKAGFAQGSERQETAQSGALCFWAYAVSLKVTGEICADEGDAKLFLGESIERVEAYIKGISEISQSDLEKRTLELRANLLGAREQLDDKVVSELCRGIQPPQPWERSLGNSIQLLNNWIEFYRLLSVPGNLAKLRMELERELSEPRKLPWAPCP